MNLPFWLLLVIVIFVLFCINDLLDKLWWHRFFAPQRAQREKDRVEAQKRAQEALTQEEVERQWRAREAERERELRDREEAQKQEEKRRADEAQQAEEPKKRRRKPAQTDVFDPYEVLKVDRGASGGEIRTAYLRELGRYHPDKVSHLGDEFQKIAAEKTREIIKAYETLKRNTP